MNIQDVLEDRVVASDIDLPVDEVVRQFGRKAIKHLGIKRAPKLKLISSKDAEDSFGHYDPPTDTITLVVGDRHIMDILRTLAHELTHCKQFQDKDVPIEAGETGSPWENEANAEAGVIMRDFQQTYPEFFKSRVVAEASGYIPTKKQAKDPRFSTALTVDIHPGQTGKEANKLALKTNSQGVPALLQPNAGNIMKTTRSKFTEPERAIMEGGHELPSAPRPSFNFLRELKIDNANGIAAVPVNQEVDYFGMRVKMKPSTFINLSLPLNMNGEDKETIEHLKQQLDTRGIGAPFLTIDYPAEWNDGDFSKPAAIKSHDGRHRMYAIIDKEGDAPVEVHLIFNGGVRARDLTPEIKSELNKQIVSQRGQLVRGPWFESNLNEEQLNELADQPYPLLYTQHNAKKSEFGFETDSGAEYIVKIYVFKSPKAFQNDTLNVTFALMRDGDAIDSQTGDAGKDALRIFGTVVEATKQALSMREEAGLDINYITFSSKSAEPKRVALYTRFAKNISRFLPGWELESINPSPTTTSFSIKRS